MNAAANDLLGLGLARAYSEVNPQFPSLPRPETNYDLGSPEKFIPQKTVAIRRFKVIAALAAATVVIGTIGLVIAMVSGRL